MPSDVDLSFAALGQAYSFGERPLVIVRAALDRINQSNTNAWIHIATLQSLVDACDAIEQRASSGEDMPLFGIPFGVKDNIDVKGMPTTAACPDFAYTPESSAASVQSLLDAGAICLGKTNMDQFATGLSGARSPYGTCASAANPLYVSGGSSSGSAVAVALSHVSFALGTDTGGSGRIPAGFNGIVGVKPTVGRVSNRGLVANCRSLDCVSIFAGRVADCAAVLDVISGFDAADPYSKPAQTARSPSEDKFTFARLARNDLEFFGVDECEPLYEEACDRLVGMGGIHVDIDFEPFIEAGKLLFGGPWIAERRSALEPFVTDQRGSILDVVLQVLKQADNYSAVAAFEGQYRLAELKRIVERMFRSVDFLMVPTAPRAFTIEEMQRNAVELNNQLGYYTYSANLLDLCAIAVPNGRLMCGVPVGVTFLSPAWTDEYIGGIALRFEAATPAMARSWE